MHSIPSIGSTPAERFLALSIAGARKTLYITNSYFVPGEIFMQLLLAAQRRRCRCSRSHGRRQDRCKDDVVRGPDATTKSCWRAA